MPHNVQNPPLAGDYLVATFADLMNSPRFRKSVWVHMQVAEKRRLESLRQQAIYGDAPSPNGNSTSADEHPGITAVTTGRAAATGNANLAAADHSEGEAVADTAAAATPPPVVEAQKGSGSGKDGKPSTAQVASPIMEGTGLAPPPPPRWFDIAGRTRYAAWVALRGTMAPDVAAECFCATFIGMIRRYPHPTLLAPVEAALSTANAMAQRNRSSAMTSPRRGAKSSSSSSTFRPVLHAVRPAGKLQLQVRSLQGDPAALALLWICRAHRIPCEFFVEPLSKAMRERRVPPNALTVSKSQKSNSTTATTTDTAENTYLPYTMADACYPFAASLLRRSSSGAEDATEAETLLTVQTPEAAFVLLQDAFLSSAPHWMGVPSELPRDPSTTPIAAVARRCTWVEELQQVTRHLRTPTLALLVHQATQAPAATTPPPTWEKVEEEVVVPGGRAELLRAVAAHLHVYEHWTMDQVLHRRVRQAQTALAPLLASTAVVRALQQAYCPDAKAVSAADVYVASCGYAMSTHPYCADIFPQLRVPVARSAVQSSWPLPDAKVRHTSKTTAAGAGETHLPWGVPFYLSGVPAELNDTVNRLLRREAVGAARHELNQQPIRLFLTDAPATVPSKAVEGTLAAESDAFSQTGYYHVSASSTTKEAAEAVQQLMLARFASIHDDHLQRGTVVRSISSVSGKPFLVLGHLFALTWALAQEQVSAFPYFMLDGNPDHCGGFSFMAETSAMARLGRKAATGIDASTTSILSAVTRSRPRFEVGLAPAAAVTTLDAAPTSVMAPAPLDAAASASGMDGGVSVESSLRAGLQTFGTAVTKGFRRWSTPSRPSATRDDVHRTHVLRSGGEAEGADNTKNRAGVGESGLSRL